MPIRKLRIESAGVAASTRVFDAESGEEIFVRSIEISVAWGTPSLEEVTAKIELPVAEMTLKGRT